MISQQEVLYSSEVIRIETLMLQNSPYLCLCYISCPGNFAYLYTFTSASLYCCQKISTLSLFAFCIRRWKKPVSLKVLCAFSNVFRCGILRCRYSTTAALQKPYTKCMSAYYSCIYVLSILTSTALQHNTATLAQCTSRNSVKLEQFRLDPLALSSITVANRPIVYWTSFAPNNL
jgi:hypothetical protein